MSVMQKSVEGRPKRRNSSHLRRSVKKEAEPKEETLAESQLMNSEILQQSSLLLDKNSTSNLKNTLSTTLNKRKVHNEMSIQDKLINAKIIQNMNKKITFLKNPRYRIVRPPIQFPDLLTKPEVEVDQNVHDCPFRTNPQQIEFDKYEIDKQYEIQLNVTNVDKISRRIKFLPPALSCFSVKNVKYPAPLPHNEQDELSLEGQELGMIAPGMSLVLTVEFFVENYQEQRDSITFINEINAFKVPILARRDPPEIDLPELLDCKSCWIGDRCMEVFKFTNRGGECGFKFFPEDELEEQDPDSGSLVTGNFEVYPNEFYMQTGETQEIVVTFQPQREGTETASIVLACDNRTSAVYTLKGSGNMAEVSIYGIDNLTQQDFEGSSEPMSVVYFENALPRVPQTRKLLLKNQTDVTVKYHWNIFKQSEGNNSQKSIPPQGNHNRSDSLFIEKSEYAFSISPISGQFKPQEILEFTLTLLTPNPISLFENATFFIDEIPFESIRNISEHLRNYMQKKLSNPTPIPHENLPGFVGSNSARPSVAYLDLVLTSRGQFAKVKISQPFQLYSTPLAVNQEYQHSLKLTNESQAVVNFSIKVLSTNNNQLKVEASIYSGQITSLGTFDVSVVFHSGSVGANQKAILQIDFDIADTIIYEVIGSFVGPSIRICQPTLDFGLMRVLEVRTKQIILENTSPVAAKLAIRDLNQKIKLRQSMSVAKLNSMTTSLTSEKFKEQTTFESRFGEAELAQQKCELEIEEPQLTLQPFEKRTVDVKCKGGISESYTTTLEISVENSLKLYLNAIAEVQQVHVSLNQVKLDLPCLYTDQEFISSATNTQFSFIQLQNLGNIIGEFEWEEPNNPNLKISISPKSGFIAPKSNINLILSVTPLKGDSLDMILVCHVHDMKYPLGFHISTQIQGLTVKLERIITDTETQHQSSGEQQHSLSKKNPPIAEDNSNLFNSLILKSSLRNSKLLKSMKNTDIVKSFDDAAKLRKSTTGFGNSASIKKQILENIEVLGQINQPSHMYVLLSNTSGIETKFSLKSRNFQPYVKAPKIPNVTTTTTVTSKSNTKKTKDSNNKGVVNPFERGNIRHADSEQIDVESKAASENVHEKEQEDGDNQSKTNNNMAYSDLSMVNSKNLQNIQQQPPQLEGIAEDQQQNSQQSRITKSVQEGEEISSLENGFKAHQLAGSGETPNNRPGCQHEVKRSSKGTGNMQDIAGKEQLLFPDDSSGDEEDDKIFEYPESPMIITKNNYTRASNQSSRYKTVTQSQEQQLAKNVQAKTSRAHAMSLLTADFEKVKNFNSKAGQELNAARQIDKQQRQCLENEKGFAVLVEPDAGLLKGHSEQIIKISVFNDISGKVQDFLDLEVEGLETKEIPVSIRIEGSPVVITAYQLGIDYKGEYPVFEVGSFMEAAGEVEREFKVTNTGPKIVQLKWHMFDLNAANNNKPGNADNSSNESSPDVFNLKIADAPPGSSDICKLLFQAIPPPESFNGPFSIFPQEITLQGREEKIFKIRFNPNQPQNFTSVLIADPVVIKPDGSEDTNLEIDQLILGLKAHALRPQLYFDKLLTKDGRHLLKLEKWALFENIKERKEICLVNKEFVTVKFSIEIDGPFCIEEANSSSKTNILNSIIAKQSRALTKSIGEDQLQPSLSLKQSLNFSKNQNTNPAGGSALQQSLNLKSGTMTMTGKNSQTNQNNPAENSRYITNQSAMMKSKKSQIANDHSSLPVWMTYTLEQNANMKLIVRYTGQEVSDLRSWPMTYKNYEFGSLNIKYTNGDSQVIQLEGHLLRPMVVLNTSGHEDIPGPEIQDFGTVHIKNAKPLTFFLSNTSKVPAKWKLLHIKNPFRKFMGTATMTKEEIENNSVADDPDVFNFAMTSGVLYGASIPVKSVPETLALPTLLTTTKNVMNKIVPQQILVAFKPKKNVLYKSKYRICVEEGPTVDFTLRGMGTYDEEFEK